MINVLNEAIEQTKDDIADVQDLMAENLKMDLDQ